MTDHRTRYEVGQVGRLFVMRLAPGDDILPSIVRIAEETDVRQAIIVGGAASLTQANLRNVRGYPESFPITDSVRVFTELDGPLELLQLSGNISRRENDEPYIHCHATVSTGKPDSLAFGGHLLSGTLVYSTAELSMFEVRGLDMMRLMDDETRVEELFFSTNQ